MNGWPTVGVAGARGVVGGVFWASAGASPLLCQNVPTQIGRRSSPSSNSTQTWASGSGITNQPRPAVPPNGMHGSAQSVNTVPSTYGMRSCKRPS